MLLHVAGINHSDVPSEHQNHLTLKHGVTSRKTRKSAPWQLQISTFLIISSNGSLNRQYAKSTVSVIHGPLKAYELKILKSTMQQRSTKVSVTEMLHKYQLSNMPGVKSQLVGHMHRNYLLKHVTEVKTEGRIEVMGR